MESLLADICYGFRAIRRSPGVIAVAVLSLGLGIGANVTILSAVDVFMLRRLPYPDADRLVHVYSTVPERGWTYNVVSMPDFLDLREQSRTLDIAASFGGDVNLAGDRRPVRREPVRPRRIRRGRPATPVLEPRRQLSARPPGDAGEPDRGAARRVRPREAPGRDA